MKTLKKGDHGASVRELQRKLGVSVDGIFGAKTENAVRVYQRTHGLVADGIAGVRTLAALGLVSASANPRRITEIIVHCEATPEGEDFTAQQVSDWHRARGFSSYIRGGKRWYIGYHYIVERDGTIVPCRPESIKGCHCTGHNARSIGVSYVGGCPPRSVKGWQLMAKDTRTPAQKASLIKLLKELKAKYPEARIYGHRDFAAKPCPCFNAKAEYASI